MKMSWKDISGEWKFFMGSVVFVLVLSVFSMETFGVMWQKYVHFLITILPTLGLVFLIMALFNYFFSFKKVKDQLLTTDQIKKYVAATMFGIISAGPIYMWFPFLDDLRDKGADNAFVTTFLYNRAVKIPLMPVLLVYFSIEFVIILTILTMIFGVINGMIVNALTK